MTQATVGKQFVSFQGYALGTHSVLHRLWSEQELLLWLIQLGHQEPPGAPGVTRSFQELPSKNRQELPGTAWGCKEPPGAARSPQDNQEPRWAPRSCQEPPGAARSLQEHPAATRCVDDRMGVRKGCQQGVKNDVEKTLKSDGNICILHAFTFVCFPHGSPHVFPHRVSYRVSQVPDPKCEKTFLIQIENVKNPKRQNAKTCKMVSHVFGFATSKLS